MIDAFLKLVSSDGKMIEGESTDRTFAKLIEIRDFGMGDKVAVAPPPPLDDMTLSTGPRFPLSARDLEAKQLAEDMAAEMNERLTKVNADLEKRRQKSMKAKEIASGKRGLEFIKTMVDQDILSMRQDEDKEPNLKRMKFSIVKDIDAASADLFQASCATAKAPQTVEDNRKMGEFASATITLRKMFGGEPKPYLVCTFRNVAIDSYTLSYDGNRAHMFEKVSFVFEDYTIDYKLQTAEGGVAAANPVKQGSLGKKGSS